MRVLLLLLFCVPLFASAETQYTATGLHPGTFSQPTCTAVLVAVWGTSSGDPLTGCRTTNDPAKVEELVVNESYFVTRPDGQQTYRFTLQYAPDKCEPPRYIGPDISKPPGQQCTRAACDPNVAVGPFRFLVGTADNVTLAPIGQLAQPPENVCADLCKAERTSVGKCGSLNPVASPGVTDVYCDVNYVQTGSQCTAPSPTEHDGEIRDGGGDPGDPGDTDPPPTSTCGAAGQPSCYPGNSCGGAGQPACGGGGDGSQPGDTVGSGPPGSGPQPQPGDGDQNGDGEDSCGAPGQPSCTIDEGNTPRGTGIADDLLNTLKNLDIDKKMREMLQDGDKNTATNWGVVVPSAACVNPTIPFNGVTYTFAMCQYLVPVGYMFEALWCVFFGFACMALVASATSKTA